MSELSANSSRRIEYIDIAKGLLIFLVVVGHAWRAAYNNGLFSNRALYQYVDAWIYAFHMPAFFFISGMFALRSVSSSVKDFVGKKIRTIAYPYLLWSLIQSGIQLVMSGSTTKAISFGDILKIPFVPVMQFWFLYALFFIFLCFILLSQLSTSPWIYFLVGAGLFVSIRLGYVPSLLPLIHLSNNFIYFAAGIISSGVLLPREELGNAVGYGVWVTGCGVACLSCAVGYLSVILPQNTIPWVGPLFAIPGITLIFWSAHRLAGLQDSRFAQFFDMLGRVSLEVFVAHTIFSAGFRIVAVRFLNIKSVELHLLGAVVAGIMGPLLLVQLAKHFRWRYLFIWPVHCH